MSEDFSTAVLVAPRERKKEQDQRPPRKDPPRYHVVLWNDNDHTYEYVQMLMLEVFGLSTEQGLVIAWRVDKTGRAICLTTSREHAELKIEQIHAYGADPLIPRCKGSMSATLERVDD